MKLSWLIKTWQTRARYFSSDLVNLQCHVETQPMRVLKRPINRNITDHLTSPCVRPPTIPISLAKRNFKPCVVTVGFKPISCGSFLQLIGMEKPSYNQPAKRFPSSHSYFLTLHPTKCLVISSFWLWSPQRSSQWTRYYQPALQTFLTASSRVSITPLRPQVVDAAASKWMF